MTLSSRSHRLAGDGASATGSAAGRSAYVPPRLRVIELKAGEVLGFGCKTQYGPTNGPGNVGVTCGTTGCSAFGS